MLTLHFKNNIGAGFTTDLWTDTTRKMYFLSVTVHFIDECFRLHSRVLQVKPLDVESHTAIFVLEAFTECLRRFCIGDDDLCTVVSDSGSNMCCDDGLPSRYAWLACSDHKIATMITTVLSKTTKRVSGVQLPNFYKYRDNAPKVFYLIDACKELVAYVKRSNMQKELPTTLKQENTTRWNSLLRMLVSVLDNYDDLGPMLTARDRFSYLKRIDRALIEELVLFLQPFQTATLSLECWKKPTSHLVVYAKHKLQRHLTPVHAPQHGDRLRGDTDEAVKYDSPYLTGLKQLISDHGMPKWSLDTVHYVAALLDPRRKHKLHKYGVDEHKLTMARRTILSNMRKIMDKLPKKKLKPNHESSLNDISDDSDDDDESKCDYQRESPEYMEINRYYGLRLSHTELLDFDLLKWWHKVTYTSSDGDLAPFPILGLVARSVLCIPASSAMSESNFSDAGNAFGKKRTTLNPYVLDDILVARSSIDTL